MTFDEVDTIVVGGGLAGLNAAHTFTKLGLSPLLVEPRRRTGGLVFAHQLDDRWVDTGAESYARRSRYVKQLCDELGLETAEPQGHSWIWAHDRGGWAYPIPHGVLGIPTSLDDPAVVGTLTPEGLARARQDLTMGPEVGADARDVASFVEARLGREVLTRFVAPVAGGIHSADPANLSLDTTMPGIRALLAREGSLVGASKAQRAAAPPGAVVSSVVGGMYRLADALADGVQAGGGDIVCEKIVTAIAPDGDGWAVTIENRVPAGAPWLPGLPGGDPWTLTTKRLVIAADGRHALDLLRPVESLGVAGWELPPGADLAHVTLALDHPALDAGPRGSGLLVALPQPGEEPRIRAKALTHASIKWPFTRTGHGYHVIRVSYGRAGTPTPEPTTGEALADASVLLGVDLTLEHLRGSTLTRFANSLPPQTPDHRARVEALQYALSRHSGIAVTGAWVAGNGLAAVLPHGEAAARQLGGNAC